MYKNVYDDSYNTMIKYEIHFTSPYYNFHLFFFLVQYGIRIRCVCGMEMLLKKTHSQIVHNIPNVCDTI